MMLLDFCVDFLFQSYEEFCVRICMGYNGKMQTIFNHAENYALWHKVGLCLHGHIYSCIIHAHFIFFVCAIPYEAIINP